MFRPGTAQRFGLRVRASATDPKTVLSVWFDAKGRTFGVKNVSMESDLKPGDPVTMWIFVDRCIVEVYVNGHAEYDDRLPRSGCSRHRPLCRGRDLYAGVARCLATQIRLGSEINVIHLVCRRG